jgi:hypothetical protein
MMSVVQIAGWILIAAFVLALLRLAYRGVGWIDLKLKQRIAEEEFVSTRAAEIKLDRELEGE